MVQQEHGKGWETQIIIYSQPVYYRSELIGSDSGLLDVELQEPIIEDKAGHNVEE